MRDLTFAKTLNAIDRPFPASAFSTNEQRLTRARGIDLILSGEGGDDLFDGDRAALLETYRRCGGLFAAARRAWDIPVYSPCHPMERIARLVLMPALARKLPGALKRLRRRARIHRDWSWAGPRLREHLRRDRAPRTMDLTCSERFAAFASDPMRTLHARESAQLAAATRIRWSHP